MLEVCWVKRDDNCETFWRFRGSIFLQRKEPTPIDRLLNGQRRRWTIFHAHVLRRIRCTARCVHPAPSWSDHGANSCCRCPRVTSFPIRENYLLAVHPFPHPWVELAVETCKKISFSCWGVTASCDRLWRPKAACQLGRILRFYWNFLANILLLWKNNCVVIVFRVSFFETLLLLGQILL